MIKFSSREVSELIEKEGHVVGWTRKIANYLHLFKFDKAGGDATIALQSAPTDYAVMPARI